MRPRHWRPVAIVTFPGAVVAVLVALGIWLIDCGEESYSVCSPRGHIQLLIALFGLVPAVGLLVLSIRDRGSPGVWFFVTALIYMTWALPLRI